MEIPQNPGTVNPTRRALIAGGAALALPTLPAMAATEDPAIAAHREWRALHTRYNAELMSDMDDERNEEIERIHGVPELDALKRFGETVPTTLAGAILQAEWLRDEGVCYMYANRADASMLDSLITALDGMSRAA